MGVNEESQRVIEKIQKMKFNLDRLNQWFDRENLRSDLNAGEFQRIYAVYYAMQNLIEGVTDICAMIVKREGKIVKDDYQNFDILKNEKIIDPTLYGKLKKLNGLRNRLVHDYNGIIDEIAWDAMDELLPSVLLFIHEVETWLTKKQT